ncbi:Divergent AAA domain protein [Corynebacterium faecale]|uniref:DUF5635 domain-containing protein n=1 Tax=Corynebacterium faecale TaxID=1758466 RepID=UPI0025B309A4|nr:DUF5635 domain-containing protein [Corynebacterium faecale]WJY93195.1 Divergent AAA domain protein [Corynebacterium faecale]
MREHGFLRRKTVEKEVQLILGSEKQGRLTRTTETQSVDLKEEAGRRNGSAIEPGKAENSQAAIQLADESACMSNSPGGGALIVGVEDRTGQVIGTELDQDWLRHNIFQKVGIAPDIIVEEIAGHRLLVLYIAESREPVEDTKGRIRWRVGDHCTPVDRAQWWEHRDEAVQKDSMAESSMVSVDAVRPQAMELARQWFDAPTALDDEEILRRTGALRSDGALSQAGSLLFTTAGRSFLDFTEFDVPGGNVANYMAMNPELSLLEQLAEMEKVISGVNTAITVERGFHHEQVRRIPPLAIREALLNGVIHRDWNRNAATEVRWTDLDSSLRVLSPGGFPGEVNAGNILSNREARYPALADLFRALGLVDKQGVGVDRMYRDMIILGHQPPLITELPGQYVECVLVGGEPVSPIVNCVRAITPSARQQDFRVAIILHQLLHRSFITVEILTGALQAGAQAARVALETARQSTVQAQPLIRRYKDVWILGETARSLVSSAYDPDSAFPFVAYLSTVQEEQSRVVDEWLVNHDAITTGDLAELTGTARGTAKRTLETLAENGVVEPVGKGRASRYERV